MLVILVLISINSVNATYVSENETIMGISDDNKLNLDLYYSDLPNENVS